MIAAELALSAVQAATLLGALIFAVIQVQQAARARRDQQAIELVRATQSPGWAQSALLVQQLPADTTVAQLRSLDAPTQLATAGCTAATVAEMPVVSFIKRPTVVPAALVAACLEEVHP